MSTIQTLLITVGTAAITAWVTGLIIAPRIEARKARILAAHKDRDQFSDSVLTILACCARLEAVEIPPEASASIRRSLLVERQRWLKQIEDATCWLVDNTHRWAGTYVGFGGYRDLVLRYAAAVRFVFLSERSKADKVVILRELTEPVQEMFFARDRLRRAALVPEQREKLAATLDRLDREHENDGP
ncbi:hypothetical protein [Actinomadura luteofluorescens]|uniref:hypothetical protein n=1 Tax=Actinomadura luteofluorescens TaxID=46163 RepID=UPI0030D3EC06